MTTNTTNTTVTRVFLTNLAKYTEGELFGEWVELPLDDDELEEVVDRISHNGKDELFITDYEAIFDIDEYDYIYNINEKASEIENLSDDEITILKAILEEHTSDFEEALNIVTREDYILYYGCGNMIEVAYYQVDEFDLLHDVPENIKYYFDYSAYARDLNIEGTFIESDLGIIEILN